MSELPCGDKGCTPVQLTKQELVGLEKTTSDLTGAVKEFSKTSQNLELTVRLLHQSFETMSNRLDDGNIRFKGIEDRVGALEKGGNGKSLIAGTATGGGAVGAILAWEYLKKKFGL